MTDIEKRVLEILHFEVPLRTSRIYDVLNNQRDLPGVSHGELSELLDSMRERGIVATKSTSNPLSDWHRISESAAGWVAVKWVRKQS